MASNITVNLGGGKKQLVKTMPTMILRQVVNNVCEKQGYAEPENYGLKSGKNFLDLSLSIRYANIAPGAKLELARIPKNKAAPTHVDIALTLEEGGRMIQSFAITTTLWDILLHFEMISNGTLNLTRRTGVPPSTAKASSFLKGLTKSSKSSAQVYMLPVVILLEREYTTIQTLKTTTLQLAGLSSGNAVLRVMMRYTDAGIENFMQDIEQNFTPAAPATSSASGSPAMAPPSALSLQRKGTDKTGGEKDFMVAKEVYHGGSTSDLINPQGVHVNVPGMTARGGAIDPNSREGNIVGPGASTSATGNSDIDLQRQTPVQDMNSAMIEANQEIRQLREQQTQSALTDRVKRLSKTSDSSDRERFVRSMPPGAFTEEPISEMEVDPPVSESPAVVPANQNEVVRQIAHRVSQHLKDAQQRGDSPVDYHTLIAQEIEKEQRAGVLPASPAESRHNSVHRSKVEEDPSPRLMSGAPSPARSKSASSSALAPEEPIDRAVKVFRPPADSQTPLSNQIDLPDDFYTLSSQEVMKIMNSHKRTREAEENRGFKTAAVRAEEEKAREQRYPKTIIRVRFPDRVQLQATFRSSETVGELRRWVASACVGQGEKFDLYTTPPKKVLADNKLTLYQAGLAPQSIVYFSWVDSSLNLNPPFLNGEHMLKLQDLPIPGEIVEETIVEQGRSGGFTLNRAGSQPLMHKDDKRSNARVSTDKTAQGGSGSSSGGLPKWIKLSKK